MQCYQRERGHMTFHLCERSDNQCSSACIIYLFILSTVVFHLSTSPPVFTMGNSHIQWGRGVKCRAFWNGDLLKPDSSDWPLFPDDPGSLLTDEFHQNTRVISWTEQNVQNQIMLIQAHKKTLGKISVLTCDCGSGLWLTTVSRNLDAFRGEFLKIISLEGGQVLGRWLSG